MAEPPAVPSFAFAKVEQNFLYFQINTRNITTTLPQTCTQLYDLPANYKQPFFFPKNTTATTTTTPTTSKTTENQKRNTETKARPPPPNDKGKQKDNATLEHTRQSIAPSPQQHLRGWWGTAGKKEINISLQKDVDLSEKRSTSLGKEINIFFQRDQRGTSPRHSKSPTPATGTECLQLRRGTTLH